MINFFSKKLINISKHLFKGYEKYVKIKLFKTLTNTRTHVYVYAYTYYELQYFYTFNPRSAVF